MSKAPPAIREAREYLEAICREILETGSPANPRLGDMLLQGLGVIKACGAVTGWYGTGKTLVAYLAAMTLSVGGVKAIVVDANRVLARRGRRVRLAEVSEYARIVSTLDDKCLDVIARWACKVSGCEPGSLQKPGVEEILVPKGEGFQPLVELLEKLTKNYELVIVDEFERIALNPEYYGLGSKKELLEEFFMFVDSKPPGVALTIPPSIWAMLDIETSARLQPILNLSMLIDTDSMLSFVYRYARVWSGEEKARMLHHALQELRLRLRVPRAAVILAAEVASHSVNELVESRLRVLSLIAAMHRRLKRRSKAILTVLYVTAWLEQHLYSIFTAGRIGDAMRLIRNHIDAISDILGATIIREVLEYGPSTLAQEAVRRNLLDKLGEHYALSQRAIEHVKWVLSSEEGRIRLSDIYPRVEELLVELQVWP